MPFVKLDCGILDSTIWVENPVTCKVWITMLAMSNSEGMCAATAPGIARRSNVPLDDVRRAIEILEGPDHESRTIKDEGRRIRRVDGGYLIINYAEYRDKDHTAALRMRRFRERQRNQSSGVDVTRNGDAVTRNVTQGEAYREAEEELPSLSKKQIKKGSAAQALADMCPHQKLINLYHQILPELIAIRDWNGNRQVLARRRWREHPSLEWFKAYFEYVRESPWLMGKVMGNNGRPFQCDLEWLLRPSNQTKVYEGKYHGR